MISTPDCRALHGSLALPLTFEHFPFLRLVLLLLVLLPCAHALWWCAWCVRLEGRR